MPDRATRRREWLGAALLAALPGTVPVAAQQPRAERTALLFGTVFNDSYLALLGARVIAHAEENPRRKFRAVTNYRGEYRIRVPAGDATYVIRASAPKFSEASRTAQVYGIEKTTANLVLQPRKRKRPASGAGDGQ